MRRALILGVVALLTGAFLGACGGGDDDGEDGGAGAGVSVPDRPPKPVNVHVATTEYRFEMATTITGDVFNFELDNIGKETHFAAVTKLAAGKTMADLQKGDPAALELVGAVASVDPGGKGTATFRVEPGSYVMGCFIPAPDGQPHIAKGMAFPFTVGAGAKVAKFPDDADVELEGKEFSYSENPEVKAGESTIAFTNKGTQDHEITVIELQPGKTVADVGAFFANPTGPPPFKLQGGIAIKAGGTGTTKVNLTKGGNYLFACLIPDPADDIAHVAKGMAAKVTVTS